MKPMRLLGTNEVCEMLGISKPTLYRWNNLSDESSQSIESRLAQSRLNLRTLKSQAITSTTKEILNKGLNINEIEEPLPNKFPRPFKIGRAYKWRSDEIEKWLETMRV